MATLLKRGYKITGFYGKIYGDERIDRRVFYSHTIKRKRRNITKRRFDDFSIYRENQEAYKRWLDSPVISYNRDRIECICPLKDIYDAYNEYAETINY